MNGIFQSCKLLFLLDVFDIFFKIYSTWIFLFKEQSKVTIAKAKNVTHGPNKESYFFDLCAKP